MSALSRKKRILNLALQLNENNCSDPTTNRNNNEERNNLESAIERDSNASSPLPSDAQNIIVEMAEVYHAVFDETNHTDVPELQLEATENHIHTTYYVDGYKGRGRPKKRWMDCVKDDMARKNVISEMTSDREVWKRKACCADPK
ncbi:uncharacterized protein LOC135119170 [Helicoverpa armigera]|uniref:uncharacterized protein LOC135119170 n=1 Tax=Helicoverpa armigera TaxID=29058 RepID=UPI0030831BDC